MKQKAEKKWCKKKVFGSGRREPREILRREREKCVRTGGSSRQSRVDPVPVSERRRQARLEQDGREPTVSSIGRYQEQQGPEDGAGR